MSLVFWLVQDLLTVAAAGTVRIPEIFLLSLVYRLLTCDRDAYVSIIWSAFIGGLLWDFRWVGIPSFFAMCYVAAVMMIMSAWNTLPSQGRTMLVVFFMFWAAQLLPGILYVFILDRQTGNLSWTLFLVQQVCAAPLSLLSAFFYFMRGKDQNA